jgi:mono/diheme cytochrome c family protein
MMKGSHRAQLAAGCLLLLATGPAIAANPVRGEALAEHWCASCHVVFPDQRRALSDAPSFRSIVRRPGFNSRALAYWLLAPHPPMPAFSLTRDEADDIAAYIESVR